MSMLKIWKVACMAMVVCAAVVAYGAKPNVIIVMTDDQGYFDIGANGNDVIITPNLDQMHSESLRLTDYHVDPTCSPSRSALMTGRYSGRNGVWHTIMGRSILRRDEVTMAEVFSDGGYRTMISGKWHLGDSYPYRPQDRGFQEAFYHGGGGVGQAPDYWGNDYFDDTYFRNGKAEKQSGYCTDVWFDAALEFIEKNKKKPFFCYLVTNAPHGPFHVAQKYKDMYEGKEGHAAFNGMITNIDENMGRLRAKLKEWGLEENTILVFTTDNGTDAGSKGNMRGQKGSPYEGGHRVPFFMHWPAGGMDKGQDMDRLVAHIDVLPTFADICGLKLPDVKLDGKNIRPLLEGKTGGWADRTVFVESQRIIDPEKWRQCQVMTQKWRLTNGAELYDIKADPSQKNDIAAKHPELVAKLRKEYDLWWDDLGQRREIISRNVIGHDGENPMHLSSHDWRHEAARRAWNQSHIIRGQFMNGEWFIEVAESGKYEITLRRWPEETGAAMSGAVAGGMALPVISARLKVGDQETTKDVASADTGATFNMTLEKGETTLQTWMMMKDGTSKGAPYVYVKRL